MTVILAARKDNKIVLASDKQVTFLWHLSSNFDKQFDKSDFTFAGCGTVRTLQVIKNKLVLPVRTASEDIDSYIFRVCESIRSLLLGYHKEIIDLESLDFAFIVVHKEGMWLINNDFSFISSDEILVHGSGYDVALGAYRALEKYVDDLEGRCRSVIEIVNNNTLYCGRGCDIKVIDIN